MFDLDDVLLDRRKAWQYAIEEAVVGLTGRRVDAAPLTAEFMGRPPARGDRLCRHRKERPGGG